MELHSRHMMEPENERRLVCGNTYEYGYPTCRLKHSNLVSTVFVTYMVGICSLV